MASKPSERDPLLPRRVSGDEDGHDSETGKKTVKKGPLGPLEIPRSTRYGILAGIWTATFLSKLWFQRRHDDQHPLVLPSISSEFNKSNQASWLGTSYLLATCTFTPLYGRLCNVLGRKGANRAALFFAGLGVLLCGLSTNLETLIFARFLAGIGGGGLTTTSSIIVSDMYSLRLGLGLGGPLGGLVTDWLGWRWAFLIQMPLFSFSYVLTSINLNYVTELLNPEQGKGKSAKEILKRIDYGGSASMMMAVGSCLLFLSAKYNEGLPWSDPFVIVSATLSALFAVVFIVVEIFVAPEPVLAPALLKLRIPALVGVSCFLVETCSFSIMYFLPMWFQTVVLTNASTAGLHLMPNSLSMSVGSLFAGWIMHVTGRYKTINLIFGMFPFIAACFIYQLQPDSGFWVSWFSIVPLGFGNAVVLQTMINNQMPVGIGLGQLFRGVGQVGGVAISSAIFQSKLEAELQQRITGPDSQALITKIRQNARYVATLPPDIRALAQESYKVSLKSVFFFAAVMALVAYIVRLPELTNTPQIPDKHLDSRPRADKGQQPDKNSDSDSQDTQTQSPSETAKVVEPSNGRSSPTM
ncbi:multidrug resistance protein [Ephemerocybe angulata]|uniref:Multidrug resistance protein n=1 Tax=Ephemerocybe angulata TaxID=980116 RepID=A0A8H6I441_9AGAR|nr:multidrug resistance protein [Tulosesus angulatus]